MSDDSITATVLTELRTEVRELRSDVRHTNERIDQTNERLEQLRLDVKAELAEVETRIATRGLYDLIQDRLQLRDRVEQLESDVASLKHRVE